MLDQDQMDKHSCPKFEDYPWCMGKAIEEYQGMPLNCSMVTLLKQLSLAKSSKLHYFDSKDKKLRNMSQTSRKE